MRRFKIKAHMFEDSTVKAIVVIEATNIIAALDLFEDDNPHLVVDEIKGVDYAEH